jgi:hypothetical protein
LRPEKKVKEKALIGALRVDLARDVATIQVIGYIVAKGKDAA